MNNFLYVSNLGFPEKIENRYNWIAHNSQNDHASAGAGDGFTENQDRRILDRILEILHELYTDRIVDSAIDNNISTIPTWVFKLHPVVKYLISAKEDAIRRVEEKYNWKDDQDEEDYEKDFLSGLTDIYEVIGLFKQSDLGNKILERVERYLALVKRKGRLRDKSEFVKDKLEGQIAWDRDHLIQDLQLFLSGSGFLRKELANEKERYLGTLIHRFANQRCADLLLYRKNHELEPRDEPQEDYGLFDPEDKRKRKKTDPDSKKLTKEEKKKEKEDSKKKTKEDKKKEIAKKKEEDKGEGKGKRKGRKKNGGSDSGSVIEMDPPFAKQNENPSDSDLDLDIDIAKEIEKDLNEIENELKEIAKDIEKDIERRIDLDDQKYLLKNRNEYFDNEYLIHDQEEYLAQYSQEQQEYQKIIKKQKENQSSQNNQDSDQNQEGTQNYAHLWVQCENCYGLNYKKYFFLTKLNVCEHCGSHLKMSSSERIELPIDQGTWNAMDENMNSKDPIEFDRNPTKIKDLPELEKSVPVIPVFTNQKQKVEGEEKYNAHNYCTCRCQSRCCRCHCGCHCKCHCKCHGNNSLFLSIHSLFHSFSSPFSCHFCPFSQSISNTNSCKFHRPPCHCPCQCNDKNCKNFIGHNEQSGIDCGNTGALLVKDLGTSSQIDENYNEYSHMGNKSQDNKNPIAFDSTTSTTSATSASVDAESEGENLRLDKDSEGCIDYESKCEEEEKDYKDRIYSYQGDTGLTEAVQTGTGELNGIPVAMGVMDFQFLGGSMGSAVGEKITRLIEYATKNSLHLILVCASGGARMQEGSLSLMQMAKISAALHKYQTNKDLLYISILTSPTTGGVTASFGMLGHINISEPNADIAFAGKRVMEQTLNLTVPEDLQKAENFVQKGLLDLIVPRDQLKNFISDLLNLSAVYNS